MPLVDRRTNSVVLRIVYEGPPEAGKATNLEKLCERLSLRRPSHADLAHERDMYLDWLDAEGEAVGGPRVRCQLVNVPRQLQLARRGRTILDSADAVVFVADSRASAAPRTKAALRSLVRGLSNRPDVPLVLQANKQDLPGAQQPLDLHHALGLAARVPVIAAHAAGGEGVVETFTLAVRVAVDHVRARLVAGELGEGDATNGNEPLLSLDAIPEIFEELDAVTTAAAAATRRSPTSPSVVMSPDGAPVIVEIDPSADSTVATAPAAATASAAVSPVAHDDPPPATRSLMIDAVPAHDHPPPGSRLLITDAIAADDHPPLDTRLLMADAVVTHDHPPPPVRRAAREHLDAIGWNAARDRGVATERTARCEAAGSSEWTETLEEVIAPERMATQIGIIAPERVVKRAPTAPHAEAVGLDIDLTEWDRTPTETDLPPVDPTALTADAWPAVSDDGGSSPRLREGHGGPESGPERGVRGEAHGSPERGARGEAHGSPERGAHGEAHGSPERGARGEAHGSPRRGSEDGARGEAHGSPERGSKDGTRGEAHGSPERGARGEAHGSPKRGAHGEAHGSLESGGAREARGAPANIEEAVSMVGLVELGQLGAAAGDAASAATPTFLPLGTPGPAEARALRPPEAQAYAHALSLQLPAFDLPAGLVWPPVSGRSALAQLAPPVNVTTVPVAWAPRQAIEVACGEGWLAHTAATLWFADLDEGRRTLLEVVRWQAAMGALTPPGRTYALSPQADGARLWVLTPVHRTVWAAIEVAFRRGDRATAGWLARRGLETVDAVRAQGGAIGDLDHIGLDEPPRLLTTPWTPPSDRLTAQLQRLFTEAVL